MLCILCISVSDEMLNIFDENGIHLNISDIITKHFWMKPNANDNNSKAICCSCWKTLHSFHNFYQTIEEAHTKLTTCLKLPIEESDAESNHFEVFSHFFTPVVKLENSEDTKVEFPEPVETPSIHPSDIVAKNGNIQKAPNSDSESEVPLVKLSKRAKSVEEDNKGEEENSDNESESDNGASVQDSGHQQQDSDSDSGSDSDSDYNAPKKKAKTKSSTKTEGSSKKLIPCKEFDSFIKQNMKLECNICKKPVENFFCLKEHFKKAHKQTAYVTCCERQWTSRFSLVHHLLLHKNPDMYKCQKCGRVLANKKSFKNHTRSHITQERVHKCPKCSKMFSSIEKLEKHSKTHVKPRIDQICEQCGKVCHSMQSLMAHQKREHLGFVKQRVQCPKCGTYLSDSSTLHTHMKYQHPKVEVLNVCKICGKISTTGYGLKRHMQYMHSMERKHKCNICEDKAFKTAQRLREHMTTHTGEVLYTCPHCRKTFNSNANMHSHRKKMHRKEWEENRRHPHMGASSNANANTNTNANVNVNASVNATEENNQQ